MLTSPHNLLFSVLGEGIQNKLFYHLSGNGGETDWPVVFRILHLAPYEDWNDNVYSSVYRHISHSPRPFKNSREQFSSHPCQFIQHMWVYPIGAHRFVCIDFGWTFSDQILLDQQEALLSLLFLTSRVCGSWGPVLALRMQQRKQSESPPSQHSLLPKHPLHLIADPYFPYSVSLLGFCSWRDLFGIVSCNCFRDRSHISFYVTQIDSVLHQEFLVPWDSSKKGIEML